MSKIILKDVRISFPRIFKAEGFQGSEQNKKYSASFILDPEIPAHKKAIKQLKAEINRVGAEKFGAKWKDGAMKVKGYALKSADDEIGGEEKFVSLQEMDEVPDSLAGKYIFTASESKRPTVVNRDKTPITEEDAVIYAGCQVTAIVGLWAQDNSFGKRINANLLGVQFKRDDEPFGEGGERVAEDDFDDDFDDDEEGDDL